ncbi:porphobilinogen synthase [Litorimonas sp. WD9-15]|uniref:porphobilinogen synthase n=1 Tax=Litorimonas sp. WD9-15 TaxID=3418716 RepID=UPI003D061E37
MRLRRLRKTDWMRRMVAETRLDVSDLIWTCIVSDSGLDRVDVPSLPGVQRLSVKALVEEARKASDLGIPALAIFPNISPEFKSEDAREAANPKGIVPEAVRAIKKAVPEIGVIVDVALDPYTSHGHDGLMEGETILNDPTVEALAKVGVMLAEAGADIVAPSDMMDGRIGAVRDALDDAGHADVSIMSYAAKFASGFYGPYRDAIGTSTTLKGDKRTYQMNPANMNIALREVELDLTEGADMVMVKPGMPYLDVISAIKQEFARPTFAFQVSGEYAMMKAAGANGWLDYDRIMMETLMSFKRAGCDGILTYAALEVAEKLKSA